MGQGESKKKIEQQFEIYKVEPNGEAQLKSKRDQKEYLMRVVSCGSQADMERLKVLLESRAQVRNQHILALVEIKEKQQDFVCSIHYKMYLVLEYSFKNSAQQRKERAKPTGHPFQESDLWSILYSCCTALSVLYTNGLTHQCLTADQIFISKDGFIKMSQPLLFGLEKNHLEAMRTKDQGVVGVHLSPQIMNCLDDQNFFYYEKEKSDVFILAMIVVDLALLSENYLYDPIKKRANLEIVPQLLTRVSQRYSNNISSLLGEMLRIDSKMRPSLSQIIDRVEKYNNIGEDFTVETQSNLKSNDESQREPEKVQYEKPQKYRALQIRQGFINEQNKAVKVMQTQQKPLPAPPNIMVESVKQVSYQQIMDPRVFITNSQHQYLNPAQVQIIQPPFFSSNQQQIQHVQPIPQQVPQYIQVQQQPVQTMQVIQHPFQAQQGINSQNVQIAPYTKEGANYLGNVPVNTLQMGTSLQTPGQPFNLYERSRSIDSIKLTSNQYSRVQPKQKVTPFSGAKVSPFSNLENRRPDTTYTKPAYQPIFSHEIPQVYNIIMNARNSFKTDSNPIQARVSLVQTQHVSTPQFNGEIKENRFTSFKNYPQEAVSRQDEAEYPFHQLELRKNVSHTQSENPSREDLSDRFSSHQKSVSGANPYAGSATSPFKNPPVNPFAASMPYPNNLPFGTTSNAGFTSSLARSPSRQGFSSSKADYLKQNQSFNRSSLSQFAMTPNKDDDLKLEYVRQEIPERGRYEGYKCNGERNGHGTLYFKDGGHYQGEWKNDKMNGFGKLYYENGKIAYQGHWQNDEFNGQGRVYNSDSATFNQEFNYKDFSQLGNRWLYYEGQFKSDSKHGKGYIKLTNGEMYEGVFDHDMIEGNGIFYKRTGEIIIGFWIDNKLFLNQSYEHAKK